MCMRSCCNLLVGPLFRAVAPERIVVPVLMALLGASAVHAQSPGAESCIAWSGEISPLPSTSSPDAFAARWARLRADELERLARALEGSQPELAYRIWTHVRCLDPQSAGATERLATIRPIAASSPRPFVIRPKPAVTERPKPDFGPVDRALEQADQNVAAARFEEAIELAAQARKQLQGRGESGDTLERRARLEVIVATAQIALGRNDEAKESFGRALEAKPELELDASLTSPKILQLMAEVRKSRGGVQ